MPKKYTTDPNSGFFDEDDMPCMCDCGNWFDLHDGYSSLGKPNVLVCQECHLKEEETEKEEADEELDEPDEDADEWDDEDETPMSRLYDEGFD